jgi:hypothetical protein
MNLSIIQEAKRTRTLKSGILMERVRSRAM